MEKSNGIPCQDQSSSQPGPDGAVPAEIDRSPDAGPSAATITAGLLPALRRAGLLALSASESAALRAPFPDSAVRYRVVRGRREAYIPHLDVRRRLTEVLGSRWCVITLAERLDADRQVVYVTQCLVVDGCYVGDTTAGWPYQASNRAADYGDALECARGVALRRMAAKSCLGCGDQVWTHDGEDTPPPTPRPEGDPRPIRRPPSAEQPRPDAVRDAYRALDEAAIAWGTERVRTIWAALPLGVKRALEVDLPILRARAAATDEAGEDRTPGAAR